MAALAIIPIVGKILDRVLPDKQANDAAKAALASAELTGDINNALSQLQVDAAEAQSKSTFVAGWRPFCGWTCGCALAYSYVVQPCIVSLVVMCGIHFDVNALPKLNMTELIGLLSTMLGMGTLRTLDKITGTSNGN